MGTALITGATSGIGLEIAWKLAANNHRLVLVARSLDRLEKLANEIQQVAGVEVEILPADISTAAGRKIVTKRLQEADDTHPPVGILVNNAGFGLKKPFLDNSAQAEKAAVDVMVVAVLELSQAAAKAMVARGRGAILNVSSLAGLSTWGTYAAHKAWVRTFTEGIAAELKGTGVSATVLCPGLTHTEFHQRMGNDFHLIPSIFWQDASEVAEAALSGVRRKTVIVTPAPINKLTAGIMRVSPRWLVRKLSGYSGKVKQMSAPGQVKKTTPEA